jgi:hypothetical protein
VLLPIGTNNEIDERIVNLGFTFSRCCNDDSHCINASEETYAEQLLSGFVQLRTDLIRQLVQSGLRYWTLVAPPAMQQQTIYRGESNLSEKLHGLTEYISTKKETFTWQIEPSLA